MRARKASPLPHDWSLGPPGGRAYDRGGCRCADCREVKRVEQQEWAMRRPELRRKAAPGRASDSAATRCACGGLLAEDNEGHVYCLACEPLLTTTA